MEFREFNNFNAISFDIDNISYIYDSYSNQLLKVSPVIVDIIDDTFVISREKIIEKYKDKYSEDVISTAYKNVIDAQDKANVFRKFTLPKLSLSSEKSTVEKVKEKLSESLSSLVLNVTEDCNFRCEYCMYTGSYENRRSHNKLNDLSLDIAQKAVDFFVDNCKLAKFKNVGFYGGEALLRFEFIKKIVEYSQALDPSLKFSITTNGSLLNEKILEFLQENKFKLNISLDGPEKLHDKFRKTVNHKPTYALIMEKIELIKDKFPHLYSNDLSINSVLVPSQGEEEYEELNRFFSEEPIFDFIKKDYEKLSFGAINPSTNSFFGKYNYSDFYKGFLRKMNQLFADFHINSLEVDRIIAPRVLNSRFIKLIHFRDNKRLPEYEFYWPNGICIPGMRSVFVSSDGTFYPCEKIYDYNLMPIGNVFDGLDYEKIAGYIDQYSEEAIRDCKNCWLFRLCGVCFTSYFGDDNSQLCEKSRKITCFSQKYVVARYLKMYISIRSKNEHAFDYLVKEVSGKPQYVDAMIEN